MFFWVLVWVALALTGVLMTRLRLTWIVWPGRAPLLRLRWGPLAFRLLPRVVAGRPSGPSKRRAGPKRRAAGGRADIRALLTPARESARILLRGLRVDKLYGHIVAGAGDAAHAALLYGSLHAALGLAAPLLARARRPNVTVGLDYSLPCPRVYLLVSVSVRPFALLRAALCFLWRRAAGTT
ncbi:MAG: DUF2953 domain-containing protein [Oscillospiraceae bacterium]|nr:DUF2953 domain-containing protein [Oscillospiraceae bacterium]